MNIYAMHVLKSVICHASAYYTIQQETKYERKMKTTNGNFFTSSRL